MQSRIVTKEALCNFKERCISVIKSMLPIALAHHSHLMSGLVVKTHLSSHCVRSANEDAFCINQT